MTLQDIMLEQQLDKVRELDSAWAHFEAEAHELDAAKRPGLRGSIAATLVRLAVRIDRGAGERALTPTA